MKLISHLKNGIRSISVSLSSVIFLYRPRNKSDGNVILFPIFFCKRSCKQYSFLYSYTFCYAHYVSNLFLYIRQQHINIAVVLCADVLTTYLKLFHSDQCQSRYCVIWDLISYQNSRISFITVIMVLKY